MNAVNISEQPTCPFTASPDQMILQTSWVLRFNVFYCTCLSIGTFSGIGYCVRYMRKHPIFNESTTILLYMALFFALIHEFTHVFLQWSQMYRSFFYSDDPCNIFFDSDDCVIVHRCLLFSIGGLIYIHSALTLDGFLATFVPQLYYKKQYVPGVVLAVVMLTFNIGMQFVILPYNPEEKDYMPSCQFFKKQDSSRANTFLMSSLLLTFLNLLVNLGLLYVNKMHSNRLDCKADFSSASFVHRFMSSDSNGPSYRTRFDVQFQYQRSEAMMTSKAISVLVIAQISALGMYSGGSWLFRQAKSQIPVYLYNNLVIWVYALSYATVTLPLLIVFCIKYVRRRRQRTIHHITSHRDSQQNRMDELRVLWG